MSEGQKGGEFFTPTSVVKLIVEILEPFEGRILDPACGSGGCLLIIHFVEPDRSNPVKNSPFMGKKTEYRRVSVNLAVHGLEDTYEKPTPITKNRSMASGCLIMYG